MTKKLKFDKNAAFKNIIGQVDEHEEENEVLTEIGKEVTATDASVGEAEGGEQDKMPEANNAAVVLGSENTLATVVYEPVGNISVKRQENVEKKNKQISVYVTKEEYKALKLRAALSDDPAEKDISAIVRLAIDRYLADKGTM